MADISKINVNNNTYNLKDSRVPADAKFTDTKNTAGSTDTSNKIFLVGATSQEANPQTYSHDTAYVGTDGCLYSGGTKVLTNHQSLADRAVNKTLITEDLDTVKTPGFYNAVGDNRCSHTPLNAGEAFGLQVIHTAGGDYYTQILYPNAPAGISKSYRRKLSGTWSNWVEDKLTDTVRVDYTEESSVDLTVKPYLQDNTDYQSLDTEDKTIIGAINEVVNIEDIPFTFENGATGTVDVQKQGKLIIVSFDVNLPSSYTTDASFRVGVMPKPRRIVRGMAMRGYSTVTGVPCRANVDGNGVFTVFCPASTNGAVKGTFSYFIN